MRSCCVRDSCGVAGRAWHSAACGNIPRVAWMSACGCAASGLTLARRAVCGLKRCGDASVCVTRCLHAAVLRRSWLWRGRPCVAQCCVWERPARCLDVCVQPCCVQADSGVSGCAYPSDGDVCVLIYWLLGDPCSCRRLQESKAEAQGGTASHGILPKGRDLTKKNNACDPAGHMLL